MNKYLNSLSSYSTKTEEDVAIHKHILAGNPVILPTHNQYIIATKASRLSHITSLHQVLGVAIPAFPLFLFNSILQVSSYTRNRPQYLSLLLETFSDQVACILQSSRLASFNSDITILLCQHKQTQTILKRYKIPLASAFTLHNGLAGATNFNNAQCLVNKNIPTVDGGNCSVGVLPTILDCRNVNEILITRLGSISKQDLQKLFPYINIREQLEIYQSPKPFLTFTSTIEEVSENPRLVIGTYEKLVEFFPAVRSKGYFNTILVNKTLLYNIGSQTDFAHIAKNIHLHLSRIQTKINYKVLVLPFSIKTHWAQVVAQEIGQFKHLLPFFGNLAFEIKPPIEIQDFYFKRLASNLT